MSRFVYGKHAVSEFVSAFPDQVKMLWHSRSRDDLPEQLASVDTKQVSSRDLRQKLGLQPWENPQGMVLETRTDWGELLVQSPEKLLTEAKCLLWLPAIDDVHNLGAITRVAVALGIVGGILLPPGAAGLTPGMAKASAGSVFWARYGFVNKPLRFAELARSSGFSVVALESSPQAIDLHEFEPNDWAPFLVAIGGESEGIPGFLRAKIDVFLRIPLSERVESLNMSVAAGISMYDMAVKFRQDHVKEKA